MNTFGIAFDMDGVIVDNYKYHYQSWLELGDKYGIKFTYEDYRDRMNGRTLTELVEFLFKNSRDKDQVREIGLEKESLYRELYRPHLSPTPGLVPFLEACASQDIPMTIGTSAPQENVDFTLDGLGIRHFFKGIVNDKAVKMGKPHPEVYQKCAEMMNLPNHQCIVFEDAHSGILAARAAGSQVVGFATSHSKSELRADLVVDDFTDLNTKILSEILL